MDPRLEQGFNNMLWSIARHIPLDLTPEEVAANREREAQHRENTRRYLNEVTRNLPFIGGPIGIAPWISRRRRGSGASTGSDSDGGMDIDFSNWPDLPEEVPLTADKGTSTTLDKIEAEAAVKAAQRAIARRNARDRERDGAVATSNPSNNAPRSGASVSRRTRTVRQATNSSRGAAANNEPGSSGASDQNANRSSASRRNNQPRSSNAPTSSTTA